MRLELCRDTDGTHFVVVLHCEKGGDTIAVPLSQQLSNRIEIMLVIDGVPTELPRIERSG